jgi:hypothetical protein
MPSGELVANHNRNQCITSTLGRRKITVNSNQFPAILLLTNLVIHSKSTEEQIPGSSSKIHLSAFSQRFQGKARRFQGLGRIWQKLVDFVLQAYSPPLKATCTDPFKNKVKRTNRPGPLYHCPHSIHHWPKN